MCRNKKILLINNKKINARYKLKTKQDESAEIRLYPKSENNSNTVHKQTSQYETERKISIAMCVNYFHD